MNENNLTETELWSLVEETNKTRNPRAFYASEKPVCIRLLQAGTGAFGDVTRDSQGRITDAVWNFSPIC